MAVTEEIMEKAYDLETRNNWRSLIRRIRPIGYAYRNGEPRRYYLDEDGKPCYRVVTESEMHRFK